MGQTTTGVFVDGIKVAFIRREDSYNTRIFVTKEAREIGAIWTGITTALSKAQRRLLTVSRNPPSPQAGINAGRPDATPAATSDATPDATPTTTNRQHDPRSKQPNRFSLVLLCQMRLGCIIETGRTFMIGERKHGGFQKRA